MMECLLILPLKYIWNTKPLNTNLTKWSNTLKQFFGKLPTICLSVFDHFVKLMLKGLISFYLVFWNIMILCFLSYRRKLKERLVNSWCIFMLFLVFVRHFLVYLSELFGSEFVRAGIFICLSLFVLQLWIYSIYLPAIYLPVCLYKVICPRFLKAVLSVETVPFIKTVYREIQIQR